MSVRYSAIAALGLNRAGEATRRQVLGGQDLPELLPGILGLALAGRDPGALALAVWSTVEVASATSGEAALPERDRLARALDRLLRTARAGVPLATIDQAWALMALLAAGRSPAVAELAGGAEQVAEATDCAAAHLLASQGAGGLFPHHVAPGRSSRLRSHVSCFADQAYPIQALSRYSAAAGGARALEAAVACAERIVALQGDQGQWWWHYDWRRGSVIERYPVYSVHQYALAPMALLEVRDAGGPAHGPAIAKGLGWLVEHPEAGGELIVDELGVVWRTVGRHEPSKIVRTFRSAASAAAPGLRLSWLDWVFPPGPVQRECRPFELGWLLYAWHDDNYRWHGDGEVMVPRWEAVAGVGMAPDAVTT